MDKEAGPEGAEVPSASSAADGGGDVSMDYKRFWRELGDALGMQPGTGNYDWLHPAYPELILQP